MSKTGHFKGKNITVMGLDAEGRGVQDAVYLAECGAKIVATDLKNEAELGSHITELRAYKNIELILGEHRMEDFEDKDLIVRAASVPIGSKFIEHAEKNHIEVQTDETLFLKYAPKIKLVGVTGTRGKSTVTQLIYHILNEGDVRAHIGGNFRGLSMLPLLENVKDGDVVVMELSSWQMQQFGKNKLSPTISVFTTFFPDHMDYYQNSMQRYFDDKAQIFKYQKSEDVLIMSPQAKGAIDNYYKSPINSKKIVVEPLPLGNRFLVGVHNEYNAACAAEVALRLGMTEDEILQAIKTFPGVEGRLRFVREINGVSIYNDNNATTPEATVVGLKALSKDKNIILIVGGSDKGLDMSELIREIPKRCKAVMLFSGKGTDTIASDIMKLDGVIVKEEKDFKTCVKEAIKIGRKGDVVLFSPSFASFGYFKNEYERNDQFLSIVKNL